MSLTRLIEAPLKEVLTNNAGTLDKVWLQYVADLAESTAGYWGNVNNTLEITGVTVDPEDKVINKLVIQSNMVSIYLSYENLTTSSAVVTIPKKYRVLDGPLTITEVDDAGVIVATSYTYVKDLEFKIPDMITTNNVLISGCLIKSQGE